MSVQPDEASLGSMNQEFVRLGEELKAAREQRRPKLSQQAAADALGVGRSTVQKMERGEGGQVTVTTVRGYARLLGWTDASVDQVLAGGKPVLASEAPGDSGPAPALGLSPAVEYELRSGETVDSQVFNLGPDEDDGHIIVVVQGKKGMSPEQLERIAARSRAVRRRLQGIGAEADEVAES